MWNYLSKGDIVEIVAPSCGVSLKRLELAKKHLETWGFIPRISTEIFGEDPIYANSKEQRLKNMIRALEAEDSKAIWCIRGGSGSTQLIPYLSSIPRPKKEKLFIGFSDATSLHILFHQKWKWTPIHGPALSQISEKTISSESIKLIKNVVCGKQKNYLLKGLIPLNKSAKQSSQIQSKIVGGNLSLVQYGLGTTWQLATDNKIFFCEEVNEPAYRIAERIEHLKQNGLFDKCLAIIFGDFTFSKNDKEQNLYSHVLKQFAEETSIPTLRCLGIGHGDDNFAIPFGAKSLLKLEKSPSLNLYYQ